MNNGYGTNYRGGFTSVHATARTLGITRQAVYGMIKRQELPHVAGKGVPVDAVNQVRKARIKAAFEEYERLRDIPEL